jgi:hypothetical protein
MLYIAELFGAITALITAWLEVRVLSAPPRSRHQTEISRFFMKTPELAGIRARILSLQAADWISGVVLGPLSLPCKITFPHGEGRVGGDSMMSPAARRPRCGSVKRDGMRKPSPWRACLVVMGLAGVVVFLFVIEPRMQWSTIPSANPDLFPTEKAPEKEWQRTQSAIGTL